MTATASSQAEINATIRTFMHDGNPPEVRSAALAKMLDYRARAAKTADPVAEALFHHAAKSSRDLELFITVAEPSDEVLYDAAVEHYLIGKNEVTSQDLMTPVAMCNAIKRFATCADPALEIRNWNARKFATMLQLKWLAEAGVEVQIQCVERFDCELRESNECSWLVQALSNEADMLGRAVTKLGAETAIGFARIVSPSLENGWSVTDVSSVFLLACACLADMADEHLPRLRRLTEIVPVEEQRLLLYVELAKHALRSKNESFWIAAVEWIIAFARDSARKPENRIAAAKWAIVVARNAECGGKGVRGAGRDWGWAHVYDRIEVLHRTPPFGDALRVDLHRVGRLRAPGRSAI